MFPRAINFHLLRACNAQCRYCFARFPETPKQLSTSDAIEVMRRVRDGGGEKMNFVGGEPTLHPDIDRLVLAAKELGFTTSIVSNGARLARLLASPAGRCSPSRDASRPLSHAALIIAFLEDRWPGR